MPSSPLIGHCCACHLQGALLDAHPANEPTTTPGVMTGGGPWGMAAQQAGVGNEVFLYVSYVLGTNPKSMDPLTGELQAWWFDSVVDLTFD
jgi:hypothetical protein